MRDKMRSRRIWAMTAVGGLGLGLLGGLAASPAEAASLKLNYTCMFPLINQQAVAVNIDLALPATVKAGVQTPPFDIKAIATLSGNTTSGLSLIGAKTIEGKAVAYAALAAPQVNLPSLAVPVSVAKTNVPASGAFDVVATGQTPAITFPQAGDGTIDVGKLDLNIIARDANGAPIALPGGKPDGSFDAPCTVDAGQSTRLANFTITGDTPPPPPGNTAPTAGDVTGVTDAGKAVQVALKGADADGDALTYTVGQPANGTAAVSGATATYTPKAGFTGTDSFTYTVSDGKANATAKVSVTVNGSTPPPPPPPPPGLIDYKFDLAGSTKIAKLDGTLPLAGNIAAKYDLSTGNYTADLALKDTTGNFKVMGFLPVTAKVAFEQVGKTTGTLKDGKLTAKASMYVKLPSVSAFGFPIGGGANCKTVSPAAIDLASTANPFNPLAGGPIASTYTLPALNDQCGQMGSFVSMFMAGPGNTITAKLTPGA